MTWLRTHLPRAWLVYSLRDRCKAEVLLPVRFLNNLRTVLRVWNECSRNRSDGPVLGAIDDSAKGSGGILDSSIDRADTVVNRPVDIVDRSVDIRERSVDAVASIAGPVGRNPIGEIAFS